MSLSVICERSGVPTAGKEAGESPAFRAGGHVSPAVPLSSRPKPANPERVTLKAYGAKWRWCFIVREKLTTIVKVILNANGVKN